MKKRVCLGAFAGAHGVKGETKVKTFTEAPQNVCAYGPVETEDGKRSFTLRIVRVLKDDLVIARAAEIASREDAAALAGRRLYVDRALLPSTGDDEFYLEDLMGLDACAEDGARVGVVAAVHNFGAGDIIEVKSEARGALLLPFTLANVPVIDVAKRRIVLSEGALAPPGNDDAEEGG